MVGSPYPPVHEWVTGDTDGVGRVGYNWVRVAIYKCRIFFALPTGTFHLPVVSSLYLHLHTLPSSCRLLLVSLSSAYNLSPPQIE